MDELQQLASQAAMKKMMQDGYFSICTIDKILKMSGGIPEKYDYDILSTLHCVHFSDMAPELRRGLPLLIKRVLDSEPIEISYSQKDKLLLLEA